MMSPPFSWTSEWLLTVNIEIKFSTSDFKFLSKPIYTFAFPLLGFICPLLGFKEIFSFLVQTCVMFIFMSKLWLMLVSDYHSECFLPSHLNLTLSFIISSVLSIFMSFYILILVLTVNPSHTQCLSVLNIG